LPRRDWHTYKHDHNIEAYNFLNKTIEFTDWKVVVLFYATLHDVDAFFSSLPIPKHPKRHRERRKLVTQHLRPIAQEYYILYELSRWARYEELNITQQFVNTAYESYSKVHSYLHPTKKV